MKVNQPGYVTRIASGCSKEEEQEEKDWHETHVSEMMSPNFRIHFTPKYSNIKDHYETKGGKFSYFNKPFGLRHWFENSEEMGLESNKIKNSDDIVILLDPDMMLLRPITGDFSNSTETIMKFLHPRTKESSKKVQHGLPFAAVYGYGWQWKQKVDLDVVTGDSNTPIKNIPNREMKFYPVGPPYIATAKDFYNIAVKWTEFAPRVHEQYPHLLAEMFAYSLSIGHLQLPHQTVQSLMISDIYCGGEAWDFIDNIKEQDICTLSRHEQYVLPSVLHYCQRYIVKDFMFTKRRVAKDFFTCESPLLMEPQKDIFNHRYKVDKFGRKEELEDKYFKRALFPLCKMILELNEAAEFFKANHCSVGQIWKKSLKYKPQ